MKAETIQMLNKHLHEREQMTASMKDLEGKLQEKKKILEDLKLQAVEPKKPFFCGTNMSWLLFILIMVILYAFASIHYGVLYIVAIVYFWRSRIYMKKVRFYRETCVSVEECAKAIRLQEVQIAKLKSNRRCSLTEDIRDVFGILLTDTTIDDDLYVECSKWLKDTLDLFLDISYGVTKEQKTKLMTKLKESRITLAKKLNSPLGPVEMLEEETEDIMETDGEDNSTFTTGKPLLDF